MADVIEAAVKLPGIGNDRIAAVGVTGRVYSQAKRLCACRSITKANLGTSYPYAADQRVYQVGWPKDCSAFSAATS
jgi:hypothetical protein